MNGMVAFWARNSVAANLVMVLAFVLGIFGFAAMEEEIFPAADFNGASVSIAWPGASPQDVEDQLLLRLEDAMVGLEGLKRTTAVAREGAGFINLEAKNSTDMTRFMEEVKNRTDQISNLPEASFPPQVQRWRNEDQYLGIAVYGNVDPTTMKRVTERIRKDVSLLRGGELAQVWGTNNEEISIEVSEESLRRYDLTFDEVSRAIRSSSVNVSGGRIRTETGEIALETRSRAFDEKTFGDIIIRQSIDGGTLRVRDVATVVDGFEEAQFEATYNGAPTAFVMINQPEEMHIREYTRAVNNYIAEFNARPNEPVKLDLLFTQSDFFERLWGTITGSAVFGAFLVLVVLLLFLRPVIAFWVTMGVITAFAGSFAFFPMAGVSLNLLSLFAILLVIGILVDDAIVVGEQIHREVESGRGEGEQAAITGTKVVMTPVIFGVLTTMIMFAPWAFLSGPERQFTQQVTFVVCIALAVSLFESLFILPAHLAHMKKQKPSTRRSIFSALGAVQRATANSLLWFAQVIYKPALEWAIKLRYATMAVFIVLFMWANAIVGAGIVPFRIMPEIEGDLIYVRIDMPDGSPFSRAAEVRDQLEAGVNAATVTLEERYPDTGNKIIEATSIVAEAGSIESWITVISPENRPEGMSSRDITAVIREAVGPIPDAEEVSFEFTFNRPDTGVRYALNHDDLDLLRVAAEEVKTQLATYDQAYDIGDNLSAAAPAVRMRLKPGAEALGLTLASVSQQVFQAYYGDEPQRIQRNGEEILVRVRYPREVRESLDSLQNMRIRTPTGQAIPLAQIAEVEFGPGIDRIQRRERTRSVAVFAEINGDARQTINEDMDKNFWPGFEAKYPEIKRGQIGSAESEQELFAELIVLNLAALVFMYVLLAIAFKSYMQPMILMSAIPFAYAGAVFGHLLFGVPMALFSMFGIGAAAGVVINDNLVLLDTVNRRRAEGAGVVQSLVDAGVGRFRPILLTSLTTFVGILPMIGETSVDAQFLKPMVISLGCAVAFALFISLLMVPAMYAAGVEIRRRWRWARGLEAFRPIGGTYSGEANLDEEALGLASPRPGDDDRDPITGARPAPAE
jgi:multidrug efflux pump subunit AcrB